MLLYEKSDLLDDLNAAVNAFNLALELTRNSSHLAAALNNLGNALKVRFDKTGSIDDLNAAIDAGEKAIKAGMGANAADRAMYLCALADALIARFRAVTLAMNH